MKFLILTMVIGKPLQWEIVEGQLAIPPQEPWWRCFRSYEWPSTLHEKYSLCTGTPPSGYLKQSSGLPVANPTPFWSIPASPIQQEGSSAALTAYTYVVTIGSGIMGTAFSRTLIEVDRLEIVMLEARDAYSERGTGDSHIMTTLI
ncbi:hypothetical protein ARMGADRAFT_118138 [Armillaria gallica]|uniref:FAD dependent oxidoreductase domain-containing protein n=1 Tax=Armillaria gallica TaxID=47427 RepID=A0A2H3CSG2_ARMGA|nr:hypothetical protein ARMGADRAFT_118138 [Armillaria gallica]